jgi:hypothetical protein
LDGEDVPVLLEPVPESYRCYLCSTRWLSSRDMDAEEELFSELIDLSQVFPYLIPRPLFPLPHSFPPRIGKRTLYYPLLLVL